MKTIQELLAQKELLEKLWLSPADEVLSKIRQIHAEIKLEIEEVSEHMKLDFEGGAI